MKKVISIILAVMMLASICVPVFAADITIDKSTAQTAQSDVMTKLTKTDGSDAYTYSVTIPLLLLLVGATQQHRTLNTQLHHSLSSATHLQLRLKLTMAVR